MAQKIERIERLSARLDKSTQDKTLYLMKLGYGPTELVKEGIELLYEKELNSRSPSIPALLDSLAQSEGVGPEDLSSNHKKYYKDKLIEKYTR